MKKAISHSVIIAIFFLLTFCTPSRYVKPLRKDQNVLAFSFGGPLIKFGSAPIPIPFTTLGYAKGVTEKCTVFGDLHTTSLLFGNLQADLGTTIGFQKAEQKFGFSVSPSMQIANSLSDKKSFRLWPTADLNVFRNLGNKESYCYGGINAWFELSKMKAHDQVQQRHLVPNIHLGIVIVKTKWNHQFEAKYLGLGIKNTPGVVEYIGISGQGSFGLYYSLIRNF